jgi:hypothetical protein
MTKGLTARTRARSTVYGLKLEQLRIVVPWMLVQLYVMMATSSYWVFLRIGFMPFYSEEVEQGADRQGVLLNGFKHALANPTLCFDVNNVYLWHGTTWNGVIGVSAFLLFGLLATLWGSGLRWINLILGVLLAVCVSLSLFFLAETPIFEWYELLIKWSLLAVLALQARLSALLLSKVLARIES